MCTKILKNKIITKMPGYKKYHILIDWFPATCKRLHAKIIDVKN